MTNAARNSPTRASTVSHRVEQEAKFLRPLIARRRHLPRSQSRSATGLACAQRTRRSGWSCLPHGPAYSRLRPLGGIENCRLPLDFYSPNGMGSVLCSDVELLNRKSAGHAFALEHEVLAEGRRGRLVSGLRSAVQRLPRLRRHRERRKDGLRCMTIELRETEVTALVRKGFLEEDACNNRQAVMNAFYGFLDRTLDP